MAKKRFSCPRKLACRNHKNTNKKCESISRTFITRMKCDRLASTAIPNLHVTLTSLILISAECPSIRNLWAC